MLRKLITDIDPAKIYVLFNVKRDGKKSQSRFVLILELYRLNDDYVVMDNESPNESKLGRSVLSGLGGFHHYGQHQFLLHESIDVCYFDNSPNWQLVEDIYNCLLERGITIRARIKILSFESLKLSILSDIHNRELPSFGLPGGPEVSQRYSDIVKQNEATAEKDRFMRFINATCNDLNAGHFWNGKAKANMIEAAMKNVTEEDTLEQAFEKVKPALSWQRWFTKFQENRRTPKHSLQLAYDSFLSLKNK